jgi:hypothetical protein
MKRIISGFLLAIPVLILLPCSPALAGWPPSSRLDKDVMKYWKATFPDQELAHIERKTDCEKTETEDAVYKKKTGKSRTVKACVVKTDLFVAKGYRFFIYRDSDVFYVKRRLNSVQLGELEKAWKAGGVPAPTQEEAVQMLNKLAAEKFGAGAKVIVQEMGAPRPYGDFYRLTLAVDVSFEKDGKEEKREKVLSTLQSDGTEWKPISDLAF